MNAPLLHKLSASKLELALACNASASLLTPAVEVETEYAADGTDEHSLMELVLLGQMPDADAWTPTFTRWVTEYWEATPRGYGTRKSRMWSPEVAFAWDPATGRVMREPGIGGRGHRDYVWVPEGWVPGSCDGYAIEVGTDGRVTLWVCDWKTGAALDVSRANANWQLRFLALCLLRLAQAQGYQPHEVRLEVVHANDRRLWVDAASIDIGGLEDFEAELFDLVTSVAGPSPELRAGGHCRGKFCSSYGVCPATAGALAVAIPEPELGLAPRPFVVEGAFEDNDHAAWQYMLIEAAEARLKRGRAVIQDHIKRRGHIRLPSGKWYGLQPQKREEYDATVPGAIGVLQDTFGERWTTAASIKIPKSGVTDAARDLVAEAKANGEAERLKAEGVKLTMKLIEERVRSGMEAVGALKVKENVAPREFVPKWESEEPQQLGVQS